MSNERYLPCWNPKQGDTMMKGYELHFYKPVTQQDEDRLYLRNLRRKVQSRLDYLRSLPPTLQRIEERGNLLEGRAAIRWLKALA